ncbi:MAG: hypothetical protein KAT68_13980 [Bacteroidales bacterium]|nr:hypothetical protein [Bacteroidales bacterium]
MATGLENLWIYKLAEDLEIEVHKMTKCFSDICFLNLNELKRVIIRTNKLNNNNK